LFCHCRGSVFAFLLSSSAQKLGICPFPKEVTGGEAGACAGADTMSCVLNCCQMTAGFWWVFYASYQSIQ